MSTMIDHRNSRRGTSRRIALILAAAAAALCTALVARGAHAADFSGNLTLTSDYVFRGVSQTDEDPALQLGLKLAADNGLYASLWGSNVDYGDAIGSDAELDFVVGWGGDIADNLALDVNLTRYTYPGTEDAFDIDYNELNTTLTWNQRWWLLLGYSNDVFASDENGTYVQIGGKFPINDAFRIEAFAAHYALGDAFVDDYQHAGISAIYAWKQAEFRLTGHWTSDSTEQLFGAVGDSRIEAAATWNF